MKADFVCEMKPLGPRLEAAARALSTAKQQLPAWLAPLTAVVKRAAQAPLARTVRFVRVEATDVRGIDAPASATRTSDVAHGLPDGVRARLRSQVGEAADRLQVHDDEQAHRVAREHRADAVAFGADVYFARGRYQPHDARGFALLAHEAVHVEHAIRSDASWQRTSSTALAAEEASAHALERAVLRGAHVASLTGLALPPPAPHALPAAAPVTTPQPTGATAQRPMAAAADRALDVTASGSAMEKEAMRQILMRDLMSQIRTDMERGG